MSHRQLTAASLAKHLRLCGYSGVLLRTDFPLTKDRSVPLACFAREPLDARTACILAADIAEHPQDFVSACRTIGAPYVFLCRNGSLEWWRQTAAKPKLELTVSASGVTEFFREHLGQLAPESVYRAKTWGRFDVQQQLTFVDVGLMPVVEAEIGRHLGRLIERNVARVKSELGWTAISKEDGQWLLKAVFWLVAAKILADKDVPGFEDIAAADIGAVYQAVADHYGSSQPVPLVTKQRRRALERCAIDIGKSSPLAHVTTESLAYVYENTLISKETRQELGTHSTPSYLVDYIVYKLADWITEIPLDERNVFEPACGHAAFLVAAMRLLRELLLPQKAGPVKRHAYLRDRLHGCEIDPFAIEIARLSLTLADVPNPDGWNLISADMFDGSILSDGAAAATILLANPPFENNKAGEMLARTIPALRPGAVFGIVVPQGLLHSRQAAPLRRLLVEECDIAEICLFPDKVFNKSDMESAILLGRKITKGALSQSTISYRRVREKQLPEFKATYAVSAKRTVDRSRFTSDNEWNLRVPDLEDVWMWCRNFQRLKSIATVAKGLDFVGKNSLPPDAVTWSNHKFKGAVQGFVQFGSDVQLHGLPARKCLNLDSSVVATPRAGTTTGIPQILVNYAPVSRGPWRLKALIDRDGHAVTSRFLVVRPRSRETPLEFLWALCNSPLANAYTYTHSMKRDILAGTLETMPIPSAAESAMERVTRAACEYLSAVATPDEGLARQVGPERARRLLMQVDAEVLRLYDLPPRLERQLLDVFAGWERKGVPFAFDRYYPPEFEPCFSLHDYIDESYAESTAGALREKHRDIDSEEWSAAMKAAIDAFQE